MNTQRSPLRSPGPEGVRGAAAATRLNYPGQGQHVAPALRNFLNRWPW